MSTRIFLAPLPDAFSIKFWDGARDSQFLIVRCESCGAAHFYPRPFCPDCWATNTRWEVATGKGTIYTYSVVRHTDHPSFSGQVPYAVAIVELEEGPRVMTTITTVNVRDVRVGMAVEVHFAPTDSHFKIPVFRPTHS